jgi:hypothetical protein
MRNLLVLIDQETSRNLPSAPDIRAIRVIRGE